MKIQQHTELEVYKKAFDAAMLLFEGRRNFPKKRFIRLQIRFDDPRDRFVQI
jgi:hypothetical protein